MISIHPVELFLRVSSKANGAGEYPPGTNAGPFVERVQKAGKGKKGDPWCADDIADTGTLALGKDWPMPLTGSCQELANFAIARGILFAMAERGDLWLKWHATLGRFAHVGVVRSVAPDHQHVEVEAGNTIRPGQPGDTREGWLHWVRVEAIGPKDRFARWVNLLPDAMRA